MNPKFTTETVRTLKNIPRTGWLQRGVPPSIAETVAEHTFEVATILSLVTMHAEDILNAQKMLLMGIIHDWGEAVSGDMPRSLTRKLGKETKKITEKSIMRELSAASGFPEIFKLFEEYEERKSQEAIITKAADLIATLRQASEYAKMGYHVTDIIAGCKKELEEIFKDTKNESIVGLLKSLI